MRALPASMFRLIYASIIVDHVLEVSQSALDSHPREGGLVGYWGLISLSACSHMMDLVNETRKMPHSILNHLMPNTLRLHSVLPSL